MTDKLLPYNAFQPLQKAAALPYPIVFMANLIKKKTSPSNN